MKCSRCGVESNLVSVDPELNSKHKQVCKGCLRDLWIEHDEKEGIGDIPEPTMRHYTHPTQRHMDIAEIANKLGVNVTADDVKKVFKAEQIEYEMRTGRPAAGGKSRHDPQVWPGLQ